MNIDDLKNSLIILKKIENLFILYSHLCIKNKEEYNFSDFLSFLIMPRYIDNEEYQKKYSENFLNNKQILSLFNLIGIDKYLLVGNSIIMPIFCSLIYSGRLGQSIDIFLLFNKIKKFDCFLNQENLIQPIIFGLFSKNKTFKHPLNNKQLLNLSIFLIKKSTSFTNNNISFALILFYQKNGCLMFNDYELYKIYTIFKKYFNISDIIYINKEGLDDLYNSILDFESTLLQKKKLDIIIKNSLINNIKLNKI